MKSYQAADIPIDKIELGVRIEEKIGTDQEFFWIDNRFLLQEVHDTHKHRFPTTRRRGLDVIKLFFRIKGKLQQNKP